MFCSNCGKEIDDNAKFCQYCGTNLTENNTLIDEIQSTNHVCSVCGHSYEKEKTYCPNCTADYIPIENRTAQDKCGYYSEAKENGKCKYVVHCKQENCIFVKNYRRYQNAQNEGCYTKITVIIILLFIVLFVACHNKSNNGVQKDTVETQEYTQEQKQNLMKITNDFVVEAQKNGLVEKIDKTCEAGKCIYIFWINEKIFDHYGYENKKGAKELFRQYGKLRGEGGLMRGYYSGKYL